MKVNEPFLFIAGSTKCGTTSLFDYLSQVEAVVPSARKESRFFLSSEYPLDRTYNFTEGMDKYKRFFKSFGNSRNKLYMDGTPDYMYCSQAMERISSTFNNYLVVIIVRNPIDRFVSWYKYGKQIGAIDNSLSFIDFFNKQDTHGNISTPQCFRALEQGMYSKYFENFDSTLLEKTLFIDFKDLSETPSQVVKLILDKFDINTDLSVIDFKRENESKAIKNQGLHKLYLKLRIFFNSKTSFFPLIHRVGRFIRINIDKIYYKLNENKSTQKLVSDDVLNDLTSFYSSEIEKLRSFTVKIKND